MRDIREEAERLFAGLKEACGKGQCCTLYDENVWNWNHPDKRTIARHSEGWMTDEECWTLAYDIIVSGQNAHKKRLKDAQTRHEVASQGWENCHQVTFNMLESYDAKDCHKVLKDVLNWKNKVIKGCLMRTEFFGRSGKWNPHYHFWVPMSNGKMGPVIQAFRRKFAKYKFHIHHNEGHCNTKRYVMGLKVDDKHEAMAKDAEYREEFNFDELYEL